MGQERAAARLEGARLTRQKIAPQPPRGSERQATFVFGARCWKVKEAYLFAAEVLQPGPPRYETVAVDVSPVLETMARSLAAHVSQTGGASWQVRRVEKSLEKERDKSGRVANAEAEADQRDASIDAFLARWV